jgi:hypothetical protein
MYKSLTKQGRRQSKSGKFVIIGKMNPGGENNCDDDY